MHTALIGSLAAALVVCVVGLNLANEMLFRQLTGPSSGVRDLVSLHEAPIANSIAYTSADRDHVYVDFRRLEKAPHTTWNVMRHEIAHTKGAEHGDGSPEMKYVVSVDQRGLVVDDNFFI